MESTPKKILYVITKSVFGGAQRYVFELAIAMQDQGYTVAVACGGKAELVTRLSQAGILTFEIMGSQRDISVAKELQALYSLWQIIQDYQPDIIHLNSSKMGLLGSLVARLLRVPTIIFTAHGWPFLEDRTLTWRTMAWLGSYITSIFAHQVIVVSENDLRHTKMPGVKDKCTVIHTAAAPFSLLAREAAREALLPPKTIFEHQHNLWLVTHGELNHNKNHQTAIDAIAEFNSTHTTKIFYCIIGTGDLTESLKEQVSLKGLNEYVHFLGYQTEARQYLLAFDMYLIPSKKEGLPYTLLEAGLAGLPCIASRVGGMPEVIIHEETGLLINPDNHMSIVAALDFLLTNPDKRTAYSAALQEHLAANFSPQQLLQKTLAVYRR